MKYQSAIFSVIFLFVFTNVFEFLNFISILANFIIVHFHINRNLIKIIIILILILYPHGLLFREFQSRIDGLKRDDYESWLARVQCTPIRSCFFPGPRAVANFGMSAALRPVLGAFQRSLPPASL